jgi:two-component sensor histidine kinase
MAQWSLRSRIVTAIAVALLPVLGLSTFLAFQNAAANRALRVERTLANAQTAAAAHGELLEGSRRLLVAACSGEAVSKGIEPGAAPADIERCETYLGRITQNFPADYSSILATDAAGAVRCASVPSGVERQLGDREIFKTVRDGKIFAIGATVASRVTRNTIVPLGMPLLSGDRFVGMCAIGVSLKAFADISSATTSNAVLVDRSGAPLGGRSDATFALPPAGRISQAIADKLLVFAEYGQNGSRYEFHVLPLSGNVLFTVAAVPLTEELSEIFRDWGILALIVAGLGLALIVTWLGVDRWIVRPLHQVQEFASRVASGKDGKLSYGAEWSPELVAIGKGINEMANAIAVREGELRTGLEQRDHMLREIHHRVKNNLQMISSLLNLQAGEIRSPRLRRFFGDAQNRVLTLSILHRHLYERSSWSLVDFQQFISDLVRQITVARGQGEKVMPRYHIRAPIMAVGPDTAIPVGLIVTESVSSALNHDFSGVAHPEIRIEAIQKDAENAELIIEDNGIETLQGSIAPGTRGGFGVTLVRGLAMQLGGEAVIGVREGGGVRVVVTFPLEQEAGGDA